ncbi:hypothetical protein R5R35_013991 [Gryllus longicercus]|uniref:Uncharacterized protein n=1 Tax=Gryllus longicercus TaxID=2509291 RepID=A0AAN9W124_9ORTH
MNIKSREVADFNQNGLSSANARWRACACVRHVPEAREVRGENNRKPRQPGCCVSPGPFHLLMQSRGHYELHGLLRPNLNCTEIRGSLYIDILQPIRTILSLIQQNAIISTLLYYE